jgi:tRNA nucleotidyltransferase/poly(A) polymerase
MKLRPFCEFVEEKRGKDSKAQGQLENALSSKISLGDGNDFQPFIISDDQNSEFYGKNKNLAPLVRAFKKGANWGWSKDDASGEDKPVKVGSKKLYLTGGALRDHLTGKKPRNIELTTNSSPDEVYQILKQNDFQFAGGEKDKDKFPVGKSIFWVKETDKRGRPYMFGIRNKEDEYELSIFSKTPKGIKTDDKEPGNHADDAAGRDFTINAMSLLLGNENGPNKDLTDFYGGAHHLKSGRIAAIGDLGEKLKEDPSRALRYVRMLSRYGDPSKVSDEEKEIIRNSADGLKKLDMKDIIGEFSKGMDYEDQDHRKYLKMYNDLGLLGAVFPGMKLDTNLPKELKEIGDKNAPIAWMLRNHDPKEIEGILGDKYNPDDLKKITFLIKSLKLGDNVDEDTLEDLMNSYIKSGVPSRKFKTWATKLGGKNSHAVDAFLQHSMSPRVKATMMGDDGSEKPAKEFEDLFDPFTNKPADPQSVDKRKRLLEKQNFVKILQSLMGQQRP